MLCDYVVAYDIIKYFFRHTVCNKTEFNNSVNKFNKSFILKQFILFYNKIYYFNKTNILNMKLKPTFDVKEGFKIGRFVKISSM